MKANSIPCGCGCGQIPKYPGARFVHGHHLRLKRFQRKPRLLMFKQCHRCGKPFLPKKRNSYKIARFCSRLCAQKSRIKHLRVCRNCGKQFLDGNGHSTNCSRKCRTQWARKQERPGSYKENAWAVFERKCYDCGYDAVPQIILIHHIDENRHNGALANLVPLCPTCHAVRHFRSSGSAKQVSFRA